MVRNTLIIHPVIIIVVITFMIRASNNLIMATVSLLFTGFFTVSFSSRLFISYIEDLTGFRSMFIFRVPVIGYLTIASYNNIKLMYKQNSVTI